MLEFCMVLFLDGVFADFSVWTDKVDVIVCKALYKVFFKPYATLHS